VLIEIKSHKKNQVNTRISRKRTK